MATGPIVSYDVVIYLAIFINILDLNTIPPCVLDKVMMEPELNVTTF
jgi:hypothetical protein